MRCDECKHWEADSFSKTQLKGHKDLWSGVCSGLTCGEYDVDIDVTAGWDGGCVGDITTDCDFFCANFENKCED